VYVLGAIIAAGVIILLLFCCKRKEERANKDGLSEPLLDKGEEMRRVTFGRRSDGTAYPAAEIVSELWANTGGVKIKQPWLIDFAQLRLGKAIGSGASGTVFDGTYDETTQQPVAIKRISLSADEEARRKELISAQKEMKLLWELRHPHLLHFFGASFVVQRREEYMHLVTELCTCSLEVYLNVDKRKAAIANGLPPMSESVLLKILAVCIPTIVLVVAVAVAAVAVAEKTHYMYSLCINYRTSEPGSRSCTPRR
jgi:serine/threonine protein kinase